MAFISSGAVSLGVINTYEVFQDCFSNSRDMINECDQIWENSPYCGFHPRSSLMYIFTIELTCIQDLTDCEFPCIEIKHFVIAPDQQLKNYNLKALLCTRIAFRDTTHEPEFN